MEKEVNAGYEIIRRERSGGVEIVLGHNPNAPEPYVTWKCKNGSDCYHGHYFSDEGRAIKDFNKRIREEREYGR